MDRVGLQRVFIGSLLVLTLAASAGSRCLSPDELRTWLANMMKRMEPEPNVTAQPWRTCAEAAGEMRGDNSRRALSPWRYSLDREKDRFPEDIYKAECLCKGCIVEGREDQSYNSVLLQATRLVFTKTPCKRDQGKYRLTLKRIQVPVGCTCVVPNYTK